MLRVLRLAAAIVIGATVAVLLPLSTAPVASEGRASASWAAADDFRWQGRVSPGQAVEIKNVNGSISAVPATGDRIEVVATKEGRRDDPAEVRIEVVEHAGGVTLCAVYPSPDSRPNECVPGEGGRMKVHDNDVKVAFEVRVPSDVALVARTVNGGIEAMDLGGRVDAHTVNGAVRIATDGVAQARTVNGSLHVDVGQATWAGQLDFATVNGAIEVTLPATASTRVRAETVNGRLESDFPVTIRGRFGPRQFEGTIGDGGGRELTMKTVNGSITLRRAS